MKKTLKTIVDIQKKTEVSLEKNKNTYVTRHFPTQARKATRVIYDSGWINVIRQSDDFDVTYPLDDQDPKAYGFLNYTPGNVVAFAGGNNAAASRFAALATLNVVPESTDDTNSQYAKNYPIELNYNFSPEINIPTELLPFVKAQISIKTPEEVRQKGIVLYSPIYYISDGTIEITGNGQSVAKGLNIPDTPIVTFSQITENNIIYTSKILQVSAIQHSLTADVETQGQEPTGPNGENVQTSFVTIGGATAYFNISTTTEQKLVANKFVDGFWVGVYAETLVEGSYSEVYIEAFDSISNSTVSGSGVQYDYVMAPDPITGLSWVTQVSSENVTGTFDMQVAGKVYTSDILLSRVSENKFENELMNLGNFTRAETNEDFTIQGVRQLIDYKDPPEKLFLQHLSSARRSTFKLIDNHVLEYGMTNSTSDIFIVKTSDLANSVTSFSTPMVFKSSTSSAWMTKDLAKEKYIYSAKGKIMLEADPDYDITQEPLFAVLGLLPKFKDTYTKDSLGFQQVEEDHTPDSVATFIAGPKTCQVRLILTLTNPLYLNLVEKYNAELI